VCLNLFLYVSGDLNLNAHQLMGTRVTGGPKYELTMGTKAYKSNRIIYFFNLKPLKVFYDL